MPKISVIINADTRPERLNESGLSKGVVSRDFLTEGVINKINFFKGFDIETILFIDEHEPIPLPIYEQLLQLCNTVVIRKHTSEHSFNDYNYISAFALARGEYICHFDQDTAAFTHSPAFIDGLIELTEKYAFVSYPSYWSPNAVSDPSFEGRMWASTRFFICKREVINISTLSRCIKNPDWAYSTFDNPPRKCPWTEHFLTLTNSNSVFYPPIDNARGTVFSWGSYRNGLLAELNRKSYPEIQDWLNSHPIRYPVDVLM